MAGGAFGSGGKESALGTLLDRVTRGVVRASGLWPPPHRTATSRVTVNN